MSRKHLLVKRREVIRLVKETEDVLKAETVLIIELGLPKTLTPELCMKIRKGANAAIRHALYAKVKLLIKQRRRAEIDGNVDAAYYYEEICEKYGLRRDMQDNYELVLKRAEYLFSVDPEYSRSLKTEQERHQQITAAIMKGYEIPDMDKDPLIISSTDLSVIPYITNRT